jgi:hypothetical protein
MFLLQIDQCGRLWVLDSGMVNILTENIKRICQPQLLVFNLKNNKLILRYRIPDSVLQEHSLLITVVADILDVNGRCREAFAYIADVSGFGLIVVDAHREKSWRVASNYFYPYPLNGHFDLNNKQFDLMDGVFSLALSPPLDDKKDKTLYFHSLASVRESWVSTALLRNESNFENNENAVSQKFFVSQGTRPGQAAVSAMDGDGAALFFSVLTKNSLNCWNPRLPYNENNIVEVDRDDVTFQFASGLKVCFPLYLHMQYRYPYPVISRISGNVVSVSQPRRQFKDATFRFQVHFHTDNITRSAILKVVLRFYCSDCL